MSAFHLPLHQIQASAPYGHPPVGVVGRRSAPTKLTIASEPHNFSNNKTVIAYFLASQETVNLPLYHPNIILTSSVIVIVIHLH